MQSQQTIAGCTSESCARRNTRTEMLSTPRLRLWCDDFSRRLTCGWSRSLRSLGRIDRYSALAAASAPIRQAPLNLVLDG